MLYVIHIKCVPGICFLGDIVQKKNFRGIEEEVTCDLGDCREDRVIE